MSQRLDERAVVVVDACRGRTARRSGRRGGACRSGPGQRAVALVVDAVHPVMMENVRPPVYCSRWAPAKRARPGGAPVGSVRARRRVGDSITAGSPYWDPDPASARRDRPAADERRQCEYWAERANPRARVPQLRRLRRAHRPDRPRLDDAHAGADVLVVQGGINDIAQGRPVETTARPARDGRSAARSRACASRSPTSCPGTTAPRARTRRSATSTRVIAEIAARESVPLLAFYATLEDPERPGPDAEEWTSRRRPPVGRGLPAARGARVPAAGRGLGYGSQSMTGRLERVLVRPAARRGCGALA